jgi:hypothetical protein
MNGIEQLIDEIALGLMEVEDPGTKLAIKLEHVLTAFAETYKDEIAEVMNSEAQQRLMCDTHADMDFFHRERTMISLLHMLNASAQENTDLLYLPNGDAHPDTNRPDWLYTAANVHEGLVGY